MLEHNVAIRFRHGAQHAGALLAGGAHFPAAVLREQHAALVFGPARDLADRAGADRLQQRNLESIRAAPERQQCAAHELVEGHHDRDRIAWEAEEKGVADPAEGHRPAGPHGDFPEQHFAQPRHQLLDEIGLADRNAAGGDDGVRFRRRRGKRRFQFLRIVAHHAHVENFHAQRREHAVQGVAVRVVNLALRERRANRNEFVAGGKERDAQPAQHFDFRDAERSHQPKVGGAHRLPGAQHRDARLQVFARGAHVLARFLARRDGDPVALGAAGFLHHDGIGTWRHHRAGHYADAFPGAYCALEWFAGQRFADFPQLNFFCRIQIGKFHRPAVHRRIIVPRHIDPRHNLLRQYSSQGIADGDGFGLRHWGQAGPDGFTGLVHPQCVGVVTVQTAYGLRDGAHALFNSSRVLILRNASASSSNCTSTTLSEAYQASIFLPPDDRNFDR